MKKLILLFVIYMFSGCLYSQVLMQDDAVKSKIKENKITELKIFKTDKIEIGVTNEDIEFSYSFDNKGNIIDKSSYYNGLLIQKEIYNYDSKGNLLEEIWYNADNVNIFSTYLVYEFDAKGNILSKNIYNSDSSIRHSFKYNYNEKGLKSEAEIKEYFEEGDEYTGIFEYDNSGKLISLKSISVNGDTLSDESFVYDDKGKIIENIISNDEEDKDITNEYDEKGNLINVSESTSDESGKSIEYHELKYNEKGLVSEELIYDSNKKPVELLKYEYDN